MVTIIKTNIKDNNIVKVKESVKDIHTLLCKKEKYIMVSEIKMNGKTNVLVIDKATIKLVKTSKL